MCRTIRCMDRTSLEQMLDQGLSLAEIGRRFDLHESTVGYWVEKHGLRAANRDKHVARGRLERRDLAPLVAAGMSTTQIADAVGRSKTTVRHWLREYGLATQWAERRRASGEGQPRLRLRCPRHGMTIFRRRSDSGYKCARCRTEAVSRRRTQGQAHTSGGGGRQMCRLWLQSLRCCA
jgi:transposase